MHVFSKIYSHRKIIGSKIGWENSCCQGLTSTFLCLIAKKLFSNLRSLPLLNWTKLGEQIVVAFPKSIYGGNVPTCFPGKVLAVFADPTFCPGNRKFVVSTSRPVFCSYSSLICSGIWIFSLSDGKILGTFFSPRTLRRVVFSASMVDKILAVLVEVDRIKATTKVKMTFKVVKDWRWK